MVDRGSPDDANAEALIERAVASGIDMIDTARAYTRRGAEGHNEALIARVLDRIGARERVLVSTKGDTSATATTISSTPRPPPCARTAIAASPCFAPIG
ncbi:aldo/keto reductase [Microbacterium sp. NIBRBAC000506063]|uniref:aldo/keto reductase n=1 Tax=Microbacterium sp. NIBRBAC000506063 TaxID=2734618 RepID=UPI00397EF217